MRMSLRVEAALWTALVLPIGCASRAAGPEPVAGPAEAELPEVLRAGATSRHAWRALPAAPDDEYALARLAPAGRQLRVAVGDFRGPVVVVEEPDDRDAPRVLVEGETVRLLLEVPRQKLREVALPGAALAASHADADASAADARTPSVRLAAGAPLARMARAPSARIAGHGQPARRAWVRYADREVEALGLLDEQRIGTVYRSAPAAEPEPTDAELITPIYVLDRPDGRPLATIRRGAGPRVAVTRLASPRRGHQLVRAALPGGTVITGWVPAEQVQDAPRDIPARQAPPRPGRWLSVADHPGRDRCIELAAATRLHQRPAGPVTGLVTRSDRFILLARRPGWLRVAVGHPLGIARLWLPARTAPRNVPCDTAPEALTAAR